MKTPILTGMIAVMIAVATATPPAIIPAPQRMVVGQGTFSLGPQTRILTDDAARATGEFLAQRIRPTTGFPFLQGPAEASVRDTILLTTNGAKANLGAEGYELAVTPEKVVIRAPQAAGLFYGVQTMLQLLPPEIFAAKVTHQVAWEIPAVQIEDQPRFAWRGVMLDVSRHFFTKVEVQRLLDAMALEKLNTFHWHLTDDQGWRIQINQYPKLTSIGAWRTNASLIRTAVDPAHANVQPEWAQPTAFDAAGRYGGFYTQDDIREVVAYATALHIAIVPEIEMPGHSVAVLAAYPELSCSGRPLSTDIGAGVQHGTYCAGSEPPFAFLEAVLSEIMPLFPGRYIHIGGDEVPKENWKACAKCQTRIKAEGLKNEEELQSYFIRRIEKFVHAHDRTLIGWSEILQGGLAQNAAVMDWIGGGKEAASSGHQVVMTPTSFCYFDYYQSRETKPEPRGIGGYLPLKKVFAFEPIPDGLNAKQSALILGTQANLWTEYIASQQHLEYMSFPRLSALAEVGWSPGAQRNWNDFKRRLQAHAHVWDAQKIRYRRTSIENPEDDSTP